MPILSFLQILVAVIVIVLIIVQERSGGSGGLFGSGGGGGVYQTRRGIEKALFIATIAGVVIFALLALAAFVL